jgi:hypothetical protein
MARFAAYGKPWRGAAARGGDKEAGDRWLCNREIGGPSREPKASEAPAQDNRTAPDRLDDPATKN